MAQLLLKKRLTEILIEHQLLTQVQLDEALVQQRASGGRLRDILIQRGFVQKDHLMGILGQALGIPPMKLSRYQIDTAVAKLITRKMAETYQILPVSKMGNTLTVAMADPLNVFALDALQSLTMYDISPIITTEEELKHALERIYGEARRQAIETIVEDLTNRPSSVMMAGPATEVSNDRAALLRSAQDAPVVKITNLLVADSVTQGASDVLIEPFEKSMRVRYRIDGMLREIQAPPLSMHQAIVTRIKVISTLDIAEHRLPQDGRFKLNIGDRVVDFRVSVLPSSFGEKVALRILDKSQATLDIDKLGFEKATVDKLKQCALRPHGMILITGPTGSGKTTTLYSILKYADSPDKNIVTVEDPVEYELMGINQVAVRTEIGLTFASSLRSILRQDPDIIMVGEIRDFETVDTAIKSALTGHLVLSTLHTTTAAGSIVRLTNMGVEPFLITASMIAVGSQRLVRKLCLKCREGYEPSRELLEKVHLPQLPAHTVFYRPKGCDHCFKSGYHGRVGLLEVLMLTPGVKELVMKRSQENVIKHLAREEGMQTLREDGSQKVLRGETSLEEVLRVSVSDLETATPAADRDGERSPARRRGGVEP
ncbi:MAG: Flp pilus assembly complex ATPase component TadA [Candidatus Omnitrophica bacterium]|nr:Flp pilus assembly complex ATPase component TadA [Candidatus Omnitrophota bacterium]